MRIHSWALRRNLTSKTGFASIPNRVKNSAHDSSVGISPRAERVAKILKSPLFLVMKLRTAVALNALASSTNQV